MGTVPRADHVRISALLDDGTVLSFADQRTFGGWLLADLVTVDGSVVPQPVAHLARDPLDPRFDRDAVVKVLRGKHSELKRQLLDQQVVSGIGNIYADEALWRAKVHGARIAATLTRPQLAAVLDSAAEVMREALAKGGTSFDSLYVNVNGQSGYFDRSLDAYGREGKTRALWSVIRREKFITARRFTARDANRRPGGRSGGYLRVSSGRIPRIPRHRRSAFRRCRRRHSAPVPALPPFPARRPP